MGHIPKETVMSSYSRRIRLLLTLVALSLPWLLLSPAGADGGPRDKTESPYFFVQSADPSVDRLPLKDTRVDVRIVGVIADVTVTQQYRNEGTRPIEARYVFPGSTRAAVYGMKVYLADRVLEAQVREKQQARADYTAAKREGKTAALLEQHRPNVFQMNVANILPGDDVRVELRYTELIQPTDGKYQFAFPTVVGPRYNGAPETGSGTREKWVSTPYFTEGQRSRTAFGFQAALMTPMPLQSIVSPSHDITVRRLDNTEARIELAATDANENNRDVVLEYRLAGDKIAAGVVLTRADKMGGGENFFLAMVEPPQRVATAQIVPREYVFIVDISGSMHGFPLDTAKHLLEDLVGRLRPSDTFNLMLFAGSRQVLARESVPATSANIRRALLMLHEQRGGGSTELVPALRAALALPGSPDRARTFVVVTDGYVTVEHDAFELIRKNLSNANLFAFGVGSAVNRHLIEGMARAGGGEPFVVLDRRTAAQEAERFRRMIDAPVLTHINARFEGLDVYDVEPMSVPDVFAQRPIVLYGKWRGEPKGQLVLNGYTTSGAFNARLDVRVDNMTVRNDALRYLWARQRIASLTDQELLEGNGTYRRAILHLGLTYNLLTQYTSFIAIDHVIRNPNADGLTDVDQPSPLPQGVSALAVGVPVPSTPEPSTWLMLLIALVGLAVMLRKREVTV
jgi:Ca-activated chloride channel homolog